MTDTPTRFAGLPLFPLGTVLFPQGLLPLQIFEVRYLDMIRKCQRDGTPFGVVSLIDGSEVERAGEEAGQGQRFQTIGTLARIIEYAAPIPGLMQIQCQGDLRFRVIESRKLPHGLWIADVECIGADQAVAIPPDLSEVASKLGRLIRTLQSRGVSEAQMPMRPPYELEDCAWVANRWSELLPVGADLKQDLLALESPVLRLELISDILDRTRLSF